MHRLYRHRLLGVSALGLAIIIGLAPVGIAFATEPRATAEAVEWTHPAWFKESLLDLRADLEEARGAGKMGLLLVFGTRSCSYCQAFGATTLARPEIVARLRADFDVIGFDVMSDDEVVDFEGRSLWAKDFAVQEKARFTPTLIFYGEEGHVLLRLVGYVPPERFSLVMDYLQGGWHERQGLRDFLAIREPPNGTGERGPLRADPLLERSPQNLDRRQASTRPLLVLFERPDCPACERHGPRNGSRLGGTYGAADGTRVSRYETGCRRRHLSGGVLDGSKAPRHRSRILGADGIAHGGRHARLSSRGQSAGGRGCSGQRHCAQHAGRQHKELDQHPRRNPET